ncbi:MAG: copper homeostasis protein CutC [Bacteroidetes bacterium]|nr:copper homeostasis protein CutC [Bacteroidota bacterium]
MGTILEIAANSYQSCLAAQQGGADRIELFENLPEGGCTPSYGMLKYVREKITIPVYVMIRPRGGDFLYTDEEFEIMERDVQLCSQLGFKGVVFGILDAQGNVDVARCKQLLSLCGNMKATFHRAFDRANDLDVSIRQLIDLGFERILTSGGEPDVVKGKDIIKHLQKEYGDDIIIMPGCGVTADNAAMIAGYCGVSEIHATAKEQILSNMQFHKAHFADNRFESALDAIKAIRKTLQ